MDAEELRRRTKSFALRVLKLCSTLPNTVEGKVIRYQLAKAGTSVGANYRAACLSRSRAEFVAKIGVVQEEADESAFWLEITIEAGLLKASRVQTLLKEAEELTNIMARSRISAQRARNADGKLTSK